MLPSEALAKLRAVRSYCYKMAMLGKASTGEDHTDFLYAFRTVNGLYVELRDGKPMGTVRRRAI